MRKDSTVSISSLQREEVLLQRACGMSVWEGKGLRHPGLPTQLPQAGSAAWAGRAACHQMLAPWQSLPVRGLLRAGDPIRGHPAPRGHCAMSGDLCGCHQWDDSGIKGVGSSSAVQYPPVPRTAPPQKRPGPHVSSAGGEEPGFEGSRERQWICLVSESWCWH